MYTFIVAKHTLVKLNATTKSKPFKTEISYLRDKIVN